MKKITLLSTLCLLVFGASAQSGSKTGKKNYWTSGGEIIFSFADFKDSSGKSYTGPPRFTLFFHLNYKHNWDFSKHVGLALGIGMRNIGFITRNEQPDVKWKRRSYTLGVPVMLKLGNLKNNRFLALGAEYELLFHYKEKRFVNGDKVAKSTGWFSQKTNRFLPSVFAGIQFSRFGMIKVQYYLDDFLNTDYKETVGNSEIRPFAGYTSRMFSISWLGNSELSSYREMKKRRQEKDKTSPAVFGAQRFKKVKITY